VWLWAGFGLAGEFIGLWRLVTTNNYGSLAELHTPNITVNYNAHEVFSVHTSRCLVKASNGGRSPHSGFPNCPRPQLPASHFSQLQLSTELLALVMQPRRGPHRKHFFHYCVFSRCRGNVSTELFPTNGCCTVAWQWSACHNTDNRTWVSLQRSGRFLLLRKRRPAHFRTNQFSKIVRQTSDVRRTGLIKWALDTDYGSGTWIGLISGFHDDPTWTLAM
jgi:hypothetical protein